MKGVEKVRGWDFSIRGGQSLCGKGSTAVARDRRGGRAVVNPLSPAVLDEAPERQRGQQCALLRLNINLGVGRRLYDGVTRSGAPNEVKLLARVRVSVAQPIEQPARFGQG